MQSKNKTKLTLRLKSFGRTFLSVVIGLGIGLLVTKIAGENPWHILVVLFKSAFGSKYDLGMTLFYATPLIFTGLAVSMAFHAGLFNIGAEGQLTLGALAVTAAGIWAGGLGTPWAPLFAIGVAAVFGGIWGAIPGWIRARRGGHEVVSTIMLNFIAAGIASWMTLYILKDPTSQNPETKVVAASYLIPSIPFFEDASTNSAFFLAILMAVLVWFFLWKTAFGYEIRAVGQNENAARAAGIDATRTRIYAMAISGALAGLVGINEILGSAGKFRLGFSPGYGFTGIAVALVGRKEPLGVVLSALLFGALHKGTSDLDLETEHITRDFSQILQAFIILSVSTEAFWSHFKRKRRAKADAPIL